MPKIELFCVECLTGVKSVEDFEKNEGTCNSCHAILKNLPTEEQIEVGNTIAALLMDALLSRDLGSLGGGVPPHIPAKYAIIIKKYLNEDIDSVTAIYMAMENEKIP